MPEAFAIVAVFLVVVVVFFTARTHVANPKSFDERHELERLRHHESWLRDRIERAHREKWDEEMIANFTRELETTSGRLAAASAAAENR